MARAVLFATCVYFMSIALIPCLHAAPFGFDWFGSFCEILDCCEDSSEEEAVTDDIVQPQTGIKPQPPVVKPGTSANPGNVAPPPTNNAPGNAVPPTNNAPGNVAPPTNNAPGNVVPPTNAPEIITMAKA